MPASERDDSRDRSAVIRHAHTMSEAGRVGIPMWDSSDPDRAPPPLPLNPSTGASPTKTNVSAGIAAAARQIVEKARESTPVSSYTTNLPPPASLERSLVKGTHHKRMQSLQTPGVKDLRSYLENNRSPERSPERPVSRGSYTSPYSRKSSTDDLCATPDRAPTPTPISHDPLRDTPTLRPTSSRLPTTRSMFGENTPPSATMLALQTMQVPDPPLEDITNTPRSPTGLRVHPAFDFSSELLNLTTIATGLQKEMAQLSRRSKDNATDLISLKEATNARDEDIRRSLRDLATSVNATQGLLGPPPPLNPNPIGRSATGFSSHFLDSKAFGSPPSASKGYSIPRTGSAHSFLDDTRCGSPSPYSVEGAASVAMLEKIIREMVTKEGQERLLSTLSELLEKSRLENGEAAKKVEELSEFIKEKSMSQALVPLTTPDSIPSLNPSFVSSRGMGPTDSVFGEPQKSASHEETMKLLQRIRDSITHSGGATAEVKGLVRDLRGEVLGMGRELGKKLDQIGEAQSEGTADRSIDQGSRQDQTEEVQRIVEEGLTDLRSQISSMLQQRADHDDGALQQLVTAKSGPSGEELFSLVKHALAEHSNAVVARQVESEPAKVDKEAILDAVRDGLKDFEPNIELQQFGLERDEILAVLKEGLEDYRNSRSEPPVQNIDKGEVFEVMQEALKDFQAPFPVEQIEGMKQELLENLQSVLDNFQPPAANSALDTETMHAAMMDAVKEGLANHGPAAPRELEISRDDLFDAVKASLDGSSIPFGGLGEQVLQQLHEIIDGMRVEFKQYSAANGRDTEQVLDAVKDGLESLRAEIETYVDRAQDVTGKDEIVDTVKAGLEQLREDVQGYCAQGPTHDGGKSEMLQYFKSEFEHLHEVLGVQNTSRSANEGNSTQIAEVVLAVKEGMEQLKSHFENRSLDGELNEDMLEAMKEEFEQVKTAVLNANAADKGELIETIQDSLGALHSKFNGSELSGMSAGSSQEIVQSMREEVAALKESLHEMINDGGKEGIILVVKQIVEDLRTSLTADQDESSQEIIGAIKEELETFRESMGSALVVSNSGDNTEAFEAVHTRLRDVHEAVQKSRNTGFTDEQLEAIRGEFENLRNSIATSVVQSGSNEEVIDAIRLGLDDLRSHLDSKGETPESVISHQEHVLENVNEALDTLRADIMKSLDKPSDMTVNYEILDTLKQGVAELKSAVENMSSSEARHDTPKGGEIVLAEPNEVGHVREVNDNHQQTGQSEGVRAESIEKLEVMLTQLQIKVEALDHNIQDAHTQQHPPPSVDSSIREDLAGLEALMRELQLSVAGLGTKTEERAPEDAARKEDTDAIETLLRNTKAHLDEMTMPDFTVMATKDHVDDVQAISRITNEAVEGLIDKLENNVASKADVAVVEVLAQDLKLAVEEIKEKISTDPVSDEEKPQPLTKTDLDVLGVLCTEIKSRIEEFPMPNPEESPSKGDIDQLLGLISDFRESHDKMRDSYETDISVTARAFDDRKKEYEDTVEQFVTLKLIVDDLKTEILEKMAEGETGINALGETMTALEEKISGEHIIVEIKDVVEKVKEEFQRNNEAFEAMKLENAASAETMFDKQSEQKTAVVSELSEKLDSLFDGIMTKYDDAQRAAEDKAKALEDKTTQQEEMMTTMKSLTDDLRLSIDTLGTTLTEFMGELPTTVEKMAEESKTVFHQVVETHNKLGETSEALKAEHDATRNKVAQVLATVDTIQGDMTEHNPRFILMLEEVRALINQHFEHSQKTSAAASEHAQAVRELQDALKAGFEESKATAEGIRNQHEEFKTALPALMPPPIEPSPVVEKYDDAMVQEKLDNLMNHVQASQERSAKLEDLDKIHNAVLATASEVSAFVAAQNKQLTEEHENREKEAEELALLLERRFERKDQIEAEINVLDDERGQLQRAVEALRAEKEALAQQKSRLNADVSSLETALHIRREELHEMDNKAAIIERRMMEGVMNQSRVLLLAKSKTSQTKKKPQGRDLRNISNGSMASAHTATSTMPSLKANHALVMKSRSPASRQSALPNTGERRIMSLNQIHHNVPATSTALTTDRSIIGPMSMQGMKRSHSVKNQALRKTSWAGKRNSILTHNKENETLSEEDEDLAYSDAEQTETHHNPEHDEDYASSEEGTERRTSYLSGTDGDGSMSYATGSYLDGEIPCSDDGRSMLDGTASEMTYDTGAGSALGVLGTANSSAREVDETDEHPSQLTPIHPKSKRFYAPPSDSGLGTDLPTGAYSGDEGSYFGKGR